MNDTNNEGIALDHVLFAIAIIALFLLCVGCAHNVDQLEIGKFAEIGSPEYGKIKYADGVGITTVGKENTRVKVEIDNTTGITMDPASGNLKGIHSIEIETGPQMTGYITEASAETTAAYFAAVTEYYRNRKQPTAKIETEKSTTATTKVTDVVKKVLEKVSGKEEKDSGEDDKSCINYDELDKDNTIAYQKEQASMLLLFADDVNENQWGVKHKNQLDEFLKVMNRFEEKGMTTTNLRLCRARVCGVLTFLEVVHYEDGGKKVVDCVGCHEWED